MFDSLSTAIKNLLTCGIGDIEVKFDRPSEKFGNELSTLVVNAFLYDVREDVALRSNELKFERTNGQVTVERALFYVTCSYVMTVWAHEDEEAPLKEQKLLGALIQFLAGQPEIEVPDAASPIPLRIAAIDEIGSLSEFWTSLGNNIRPSFVLKATVALEPYSKKQILPAASSLLVTVGPMDQKLPRENPRFVIGGKVSYQEIDRFGTTVRSDGGIQARITIEELNWQTITNANGFYSFGDVPGSGDTPYQLVAEKLVIDEQTNLMVIDSSSKVIKQVYVPRSKDKGHSVNYDFIL